MSGNTYLYNPLDYPIYTMVKPVGAHCNLDCSYCYYLEKEGLYAQRRNHRMGEELLFKFTEEYLHAQPSPHALFTWHGGEPLLRGIDFYRKALSLQKKLSRGRMEIQNCLQTNGLLLTEDWCRFFADNGFLIGISLDGPEHCHDRYRKDKKGEGSFAGVMKALEYLHRYRVEFNILSVVNDYNVRFPVEVYRFFKQIGAHYIQFSPVVERQVLKGDRRELLPPGPVAEAQLTPWSVPSAAYGDFLCEIFDDWVKTDVGTYFVQIFDATLAGLAGEPPGVCIFAKTCGHASAMEANGDVYACDHFVFPEYKLGNLNHNSLVSMMLSDQQIRFGLDKQQKLPSQCKCCSYLNLCNGECPKNRILHTEQGESGLNYLCEGLKRYFAHTDPYLRFMLRELQNQRPPANVMRRIRGEVC